MGISLFSLEGVGLFVTLSKKKRNKEIEIIAKILSQFDSSTDHSYFFLKYMEQKTGFLLYLAMAYPLIMPFKRGLYLKMNLWRPGHDWCG